MADFKDVIIRLQENKNANTEAIENQTSTLSDVFVSTAKTQNRSFGQSLSLQQAKTNEAIQSLTSLFGVKQDDSLGMIDDQMGELENIANILMDIHESLAENFRITQSGLLEQERQELANEGIDLLSIPWVSKDN